MRGKNAATGDLVELIENDEGRWFLNPQFKLTLEPPWNAAGGKAEHDSGSMITAIQKQKLLAKSAIHSANASSALGAPLLSPAAFPQVASNSPGQVAAQQILSSTATATQPASASAVLWHCVLKDEVSCGTSLLDWDCALASRHPQASISLLKPPSAQQKKQAGNSKRLWSYPKDIKQVIAALDTGAPAAWAIKDSPLFAQSHTNELGDRPACGDHPSAACLAAYAAAYHGNAPLPSAQTVPTNDVSARDLLKASSHLQVQSCSLANSLSSRQVVLPLPWMAPGPQRKPQVGKSLGGAAAETIAQGCTPTQFICVATRSNEKYAKGQNDAFILSFVVHGNSRSSVVQNQTSLLGRTDRLDGASSPMSGKSVIGNTRKLEFDKDALDVAKTGTSPVAIMNAARPQKHSPPVLKVECLPPLSSIKEDIAWVSGENAGGKRLTAVQVEGNFSDAMKVQPSQSKSGTFKSTSRGGNTSSNAASTLAGSDAASNANSSAAPAAPQTRTEYREQLQWPSNPQFAIHMVKPGRCKVVLERTGGRQRRGQTITCGLTAIRASAADALALSQRLSQRKRRRRNQNENSSIAGNALGQTQLGAGGVSPAKSAAECMSSDEDDAGAHGATNLHSVVRRRTVVPTTSWSSDSSFAHEDVACLLLTSVEANSLIQVVAQLSEPQHPAQARLSVYFEEAGVPSVSGQGVLMETAGGTRQQLATAQQHAPPPLRALLLPPRHHSFLSSAWQLATAGGLLHVRNSSSRGYQG